MLATRGRRSSEPGFLRAGIQLVLVLGARYPEEMMEADLTPPLRIPRVYLHGIAFGSMSVSFLLTVAIRDGWRYLDLGWMTLAVAWFPAACVELFRRGSMECVLPASIILPALVGWDLAHRLANAS